MCIHNETDCDNCCYQLGLESALDDEPYENDYKNFSQVNNYLDGYREGMKRRGLIDNYWCCTADFNEHEQWCKNYVDNARPNTIN